MTTSKTWCLGCGIAVAALIAAFFGSGSNTNAQRKPPERPTELGRYQISSWSHMYQGPGEISSKRGAYMVDTKTGEVFEIVDNKQPVSLGRPVAKKTARAAKEVFLCPMLHAKQIPHDFRVDAMKFTGPSGDGRRGSAGFVVQSKKLFQNDGTHFRFTFQRDATGYGFQAIHPRKNGHVVVNVSSGVTIHRGGSWGDIGWGNPATSDKFQLTKAASEILPLAADTKYKVASELSTQGVYRLWIDDTLMCTHTIDSVKPLILEIPDGKGIWLGSGWDKTEFAGPGFRPFLEPGHAGLILGPMDGSAPRHNFQEIYLSTAE